MTYARIWDTDLVDDVRTQSDCNISNEVLPNPFVPAETLQACALTGLRLTAAGGDAGSSGSQSGTKRDVEVRLP